MTHHVDVVDLIPKSLSGETNQDSEPSIAVDPKNPDLIVATAFTPIPGPNAPYYVSTNGGASWTLNAALPGEGPFGTSDITVAFDRSGKDLYVGYLRGDNINLAVDRSSAPTTTAITNLEGRGGVDQPFTKATTVGLGPDAGKDRLYVGLNDFAAPGGRTSTIDVALDAASLSPLFTSVRIDTRATPGQDGPQVRPAIHVDGTIYAAFYGWRANAATITTDVVVVRDDAWGGGATPFTALVDPGDSKAGLRVAKGVTIRWNDFLAQQRQAGNIAIGVDPRDSSRVYLAWCDGLVGSGTYTLHVRRSHDRGQHWGTGDLLSIPNATNVGVAVNEDGHVGLLYQQAAGSGGAERWETHFRHSGDHGQHWADLVLATTPANTPVKTFDPYLGDYAMLVARHDDFYGVFCANNTPDLANFPHGVRFQRNVDFPSKTLRAINGVTVVNPSIDPFQFRVRWTEDAHFEGLGEREEHKGLIVKNLYYERLEIGEISIGDGGRDHNHDHDHDRHGEHGPDRKRELSDIARQIGRLVVRLRRLGEH